MGSLALRMSPPGFQRAEMVRAGVLAAVATSPLVPFALFFKKPLEQDVRRHDRGRIRIPGHRGGAARHRMAGPARRGQGAVGRHTGGMRLRSESPRCSPRCPGSAAAA